MPDRREHEGFAGISIAGGCLVKSNLASDGVVVLGAKTIVDGDVHAEILRLSEGAEVHGRVDAKRIQSVHSSIENGQSNQLIDLEDVVEEAVEFLGEDNL